MIFLYDENDDNNHDDDNANNNGNNKDNDNDDDDDDDDELSWRVLLGGRWVMRRNLKSPPNEVTAVTNHTTSMI